MRFKVIGSTEKLRQFMLRKNMRHVTSGFFCQGNRNQIGGFTNAPQITGKFADDHDSVSMRRSCFRILLLQPFHANFLIKLRFLGIILAAKDIEVPQNPYAVLIWIAKIVFVFYETENMIGKMRVKRMLFHIKSSCITGISSNVPAH